MYKNLEAELARSGIKKKDVAELLDVRLATIYDKMNGKYPFTFCEAQNIRDKMFPGMKLEYLFKEFAEVGENRTRKEA
jgi:hypothetical protein